MKRFLKKAVVFGSLTFCALSFVVYNAFAAGGAYGFNQSALTLAPGENGSAGAIVTPNDAGRTISAGDATFSNSNSACATAVFTPNNFGSWGTGGYINVNNVTGTTGALPIGTVSITAGNVTESCSTVITISGELADNMGGDSASSAALTVYVNVPEPTPPSSDNQIKGLTPSAGTASGSGTNWTVNDVPRDASSITLTPSLPAGASVVGGSPVTCALSGDASICTFTVAAEDGSTKDYTVTINKKPESTPTPDPEPTDPSESDASLKSISADNNLIPGFTPGNTSYTMNVSNSVTAMNFTAVPSVEGTTYNVSGASNWKVGVNVVKVTATAKDGTKKVYSINVVRAASATKTEEKKKSSNNYLKSLTTHDGALTPEFNKDTTTYSIKVPKDVTKLSLSALAEDEKAKVEISGNSGFQVGKVHSVTVTVTAEDGSQRIYTINVTRMDQEAKTDLEELDVPGYTLKPAFNKDVDKYSIVVPYDTKEIDVTAIPADKDSRVEIIGNKDLEVGNNAVLVKVTDKNGFTHVYEINVRRQGEPTFLGIRRSIWWIILLIAALLLLFLFFLWLLFRRRDDDDEEYVPAPAPTIQFNPAFNFGSRVGTDDDTIMPNGVNNQAETVPNTAVAQPQNQPLNASRVRQNRALEEDDTPSLLRDEPKTIASVNPQATSGTANQTNMTPAMLAGAAADASLDEAEELAELRAEKRMREREKARKEAERELLAREAKEAEVLESKEEPYDIYDETVTKDELYDALMDVKEKHDSSKLKILMRQEELNREKEAARKTESEKVRKTSGRAMENAQDEFWG